MRIALLQDQVTQKESAFFFRELLQLPDFHAWRKTEVDFVDMESQIPKARLQRLKREVSRLYPEVGQRFVERLEADLAPLTEQKKAGPDDIPGPLRFKYADASLHIYTLFKDATFGSLSLIQEICLGFLCPDHEFKSKLTQFVYQQLSEVFDFSEEYSRLHQFLRRAAWKTPIALLAVSHVNVINTISSIAQHYGVGLDVIRSDAEADRLIAEQKRGVSQRADNLI